MEKALMIALLVLCTTCVASVSLSGVLEGLISIGSFFLEGVQIYEELADKYKAKALIEVDNFLDRPLTQCLVADTKGVTISEVPITIGAGVKEAFAAKQNNPGQGIDMIFSCRVESGGVTKRIMEHFVIKQQAAGRKRNKLGLEVVEYEGDISDAIITQEISDSDSFQGPIQCASGDFAVQTTMTTSHQSEINILIYPRSCANFADHLKRQLNKRTDLQDDLNDILDFSQSCLAADLYPGNESNSSSSNSGGQGSDSSFNNGLGRSLGSTGARYTTSLSMLVGVSVGCLLL